MDPNSLAGGITGTILVLFVGGVGKWLYGRILAYYVRVDAASETRVKAEADREALPWRLMGERIDDLEAERERMAVIIERQSALIDRIRDERDKLRIEATDCEIAARRNADAQAMLARERSEHMLDVERLEADKARLQDEVRRIIRG